MGEAAKVIQGPWRGPQSEVGTLRQNVTWGGEWDREKVEQRLIEAFRTRGAIFDGGALTVAVGEPVDDRSLVNFARQALSKHDADLLLSWAICRCAGDLNFAEWCREKGVNYETARKRAKMAADRLAGMISTAGALVELRT